MCDQGELQNLQTYKPVTFNEAIYKWDIWRIWLIMSIIALDKRQTLLRADILRI